MISKYNIRYATYIKILLLLLAILLSSCAAPNSVASNVDPESVTYKLGWEHGSQFLGFYVAQSKGFYAEEGLEVTLEPLTEPAEGNKTLARVADGEFDFANVGASAFVRSPDAQVTAISAFYQFGPAAFFARADSGIVTPADLVGRSVVVKSDSWRELLAELLEKQGLSLDDVEEVPGGFDMTPFYEGDVDVWAGFITNEVILARQQGLELVTFPLHEYGLRNTGGQLIFTGRAGLEADPGLSVRFVRASMRGWEWAVENPREAVDVMLTMFPEMAAEREFHQAAFNASILLVRPPGVRVGALDCDDLALDVFLPDESDFDALCTTEIMEMVWEDD